MDDFVVLALAGAFPHVSPANCQPRSHFPFPRVLRPFFSNGLSALPRAPCSACTFFFFFSKFRFSSCFFDFRWQFSNGSHLQRYLLCIAVLFFFFFFISCARVLFVPSVRSIVWLLFKSAALKSGHAPIDRFTTRKPNYSSERCFHMIMDCFHGGSWRR